MVAGETLLKVVDYPFAYSVVVIISAIFGFSITENKIFLLGIAGALGTFLSIVDPLGWVVRNTLKIESPITDKMVNYEETESYYLGRESILKSRAISIEIDKIISIIYFAITAGIFLIGILFSPFLVDSFVISNKLNVIVCDSYCIKITTGIGSGFVCLILGIIGKKRWSELTEKLVIAITHQKAISNEYVTTNSLENMTRSIEQNDWVTAYKWGEKIEEETTHKKAKRELIIKSADNVFSPLHSESITIDSQINQLENTRTYSALSTTEWNNISAKSFNYMIIDTELRQRIHNFYEKINDYNLLFPRVVTNITNMINNVMSSTYQKKRLSEIFVNVRADLRSSGFPLLNCALFNRHPTSLLQGSNIVSISAQLTEDNGNQHSEGFHHFEEIVKFEDAWTTISNKVASDDDLKKLKQIIQEIQIENSKLQEKYHEMIEWQWKV